MNYIQSYNEGFSFKIDKIWLEGLFNDLSKNKDIELENISIDKSSVYQYSWSCTYKSILPVTIDFSVPVSGLIFNSTILIDFKAPSCPITSIEYSKKKYKNEIDSNKVIEILDNIYKTFKINNDAKEAKKKKNDKFYNEVTIQDVEELFVDISDILGKAEIKTSSGIHKITYSLKRFKIEQYKDGYIKFDDNYGKLLNSLIDISNKLRSIYDCNMYYNIRQRLIIEISMSKHRVQGDIYI